LFGPAISFKNSKFHATCSRSSLPLLEKLTLEFFVSESQLGGGDSNSGLGVIAGVLIFCFYHFVRN
jgi:hypothetical protein